MADKIVRYTFTVWADTPLIEDTPGSDEDWSGPAVDRAEAMRTMQALLAKRGDFSDIDFELTDTETLDT